MYLDLCVVKTEIYINCGNVALLVQINKLICKNATLISKNEN